MAGEVTFANNTPFAVAGADYADLYIVLDPSTLLVTAFYSATTDGISGPLQTMGNAVPVPSEWLSGPDNLAVGIISTSNSGTAFPATWDFIEVSNNIPMLTDSTTNNFDTTTGFCSSAESDSDGDGFGFENNRSCIVNIDTNSAGTDRAGNGISNDVLAGGSGSVFGTAGRIDLLLLLMLFVVTGLRKLTDSRLQLR